MIEEKSLKESLVIQEWLKGKTRDIIAKETGISQGTVTGIITRWKEKMGNPDIENLREFVILVRKSGITVGECAEGFRNAKMLKLLGVDDDEKFSSFVRDIYLICTHNNITPDFIGELIYDLIDFSKSNENINSREMNPHTEKGMDLLDGSVDFTGFQYESGKELDGQIEKAEINKCIKKKENKPLPLSEIPQYLDQMILEKDELKQEINGSKAVLRDLNSSQEQIINRIQELYRKEKSVKLFIKWYHRLKKELHDKYLIDVNDIHKFAILVENFRNFGFEASEIIQTFWYINSVSSKKQFLEYEINLYEDRLRKVQNSYLHFVSLVNINRQTMNTYEELQHMGLGLKELKQLWLTILEIGEANKIPNDLAILRFLKDIEDNYDNKFGFEKKVNEKKGELNVINYAINHNRILLSLQPHLGQKLSYIFQNGFDEEDIVNMNKMVVNYVNRYNNIIDSKQTNNINFFSNNNEDNKDNVKITRSEFWTSLISDIENLQDLRLSIISQTEKLNNLRQEIIKTIKQKQGTEMSNFKNPCIYLVSVINNSNYFFFF